MVILHQKYSQRCNKLLFDLYTPARDPGGQHNQIFFIGLKIDRPMNSCFFKLVWFWFQTENFAC